MAEPISKSGLLGAITSRTGFFLTTFQKWREEIILSQARPTVFADLGCGVLDTAMVETAAYCLAEGGEGTHAIFSRLVTASDKSSALLESIESLQQGEIREEHHLVDPKSFQQVPGSPFAYWATEKVRAIFKKLEAFEEGDRAVRVGGQTSDDFRFLRLFWEPPVTNNRLDWRPYQKGGEYSPFYLDIPLVADWDDSRQTYRGFFGRTGRPNHHPSSYQYFFRKGLAYTPRTQRGLSFRVHNAGSLFAHKGPVVFAPDSLLLPLLGLMNSRVFRSLAALQMAFGSYEVGVIQRTVIPALSDTHRDILSTIAHKCFEARRRLDTANETSHMFVLPALLQVHGESLSTRYSQWRSESLQVQSTIAASEAKIDEIAFLAYELNDSDRKSLDRHDEDFDTQVALSDAVDEEVEDDPQHTESLSTDVAPVVGLLADMIAYCIGGILGRWNLLYATGHLATPVLPEPFAPLPISSPGTLKDGDGSPLKHAREHYPIRIDSDGIIVDDSDHDDDIIRQVREVFEVIWKHHAEAIEKESCEILGIKDLRDYFRKPGKGGFWDDHVSRYSKSRRKAPVYWLLQSSKRNYAIWLYYHRLDKDMLFKALVNYVEPKIRLEENRLEAIRIQSAASGGSGREAKRLEKEVERQEELLSEVKDFEDKLRRAANLYLEPDLNDGVILNMAPLHELVPWTESKKYWQELLDGKYEWSSIGKQLRQKELVK